MKTHRFSGILLCLRIIAVTVSQEFPSFIGITWQSLNCIGEDRALTSTDVKLTYNYSASNVRRTTTGPIIRKSNGDTKYTLNYSNIGINTSNKEADYYFVQLEHGGGECNCVDIQFNSDIANRYEIIYNELK